MKTHLPILLRKQLKKSVLFLLLSGFTTPQLHGQEKDSILPENSFGISAILRFGSEIRDGSYRPLYEYEKPAAFISNRMRLTFDYSYKDILSLRIAPQQVGLWGQASMIMGIENSGNRIALYETWAQLKLNSDWKLKLGRQVIALDDERIFGEYDWAQGGLVHDAISIHYNKNKYQLKGFFAFNQNYKALYNNNLANISGSLFSTSDALPYKWMQTLWSGIDVGKASKLSFLLSNLGFQNADSSADTTAKTYFTQIYGTNYFIEREKFSGRVSAYYQGGENSLGIRNQGFNIAVSVDYKVNGQWNIGLGSDFVSGSDIGSTQHKNKVFSSAFSSIHNFYGSMDYYYAGSSHNTAGISDTYLKASFNGKQGYNIHLTLHQFVTPNEIINSEKRYNKDLGRELDLSVIYKINKFATFAGGYSFYLNTSTLSYLKSVPHSPKYQQWAWFALIINPTLLKT
ncbi:MAG: alginate export family protein [Chitinophagales bacterium]|nr:alginate export family protein [Chitinophagales bacterium]